MPYDYPDKMQGGPVGSDTQIFWLCNILQFVF